MTTATIITIGDELLIGQTIDSNSAWIGQHLAGIGLQIKRRIAIGDDKEEIKAAIKQAEDLSDIIIITGGLGPTSDDITKPTLCEYFDTKLEVHEETLKHVTTFFKKRNRELLQSNRDQALLPASCTPLKNDVGTAPGMMFKKDSHYYFSLPGVPFEMKHLITERVTPVLVENFNFDNITHRTLLTAGIGESFLAERLIDFEKSLPENISIAYLPSLGTVKIRLSSYNASETLNTSFEELADLVSDVLVLKEDLPLEKIIHNKLLGVNKTLAIAESCTGGYIAHKFTSISNASKIFKGSAVCYAEISKYEILGVKKETLNEHTAISKEVAIEMAEQARIKYNADFGLSTTGYLEGDETYFFCAVNDAQKTIVKRFSLPYNRSANLKLATSMALQLLVKYIKKAIV